MSTNRLIVTTSWDDGSVLDLRLSELLARHGIKGTFYVPRSHRRATPLRKEDILALANKGHEVGAHTLGHIDLTSVSLSEARAEIEGSKTYLEDILGKRVRMFCYPYGRYNEKIEALVASSGFAGARTLEYTRTRTVANPYELGVTLHASNSSPRTTLRIWREYKMSPLSLMDWDIRAKSLFHLALAEGGIWHLWGHSWEIDSRHDWNKLDRVLDYVSKREGVRYATNSEVVDICLAGIGRVPHAT
jgi:peptidoglycan/xylan/chitin deacetylase (PgdA/CDA1 family)